MRHNLLSSQFVKTVKTATGQRIPLVNGIMNSENHPKEKMTLFTDLANVAKCLMDETSNHMFNKS